MKQKQLKLSHIKQPLLKQTGAALIIGLVLLIAMTVIGIGALSTTGLEHRMAGNMGCANLAFNAADTVGRVMQKNIDQLKVPPAEKSTCAGTTTDTPPPCVLNKQTAGWWEDKDHSWWKSNATVLEGAGALKFVKTQPRAVVANQQFVPDSLVVGLDYVTKGTQYYRITSRGTGCTDNSQAIVQQTVVKRFN